MGGTRAEHGAEPRAHTGLPPATISNFIAAGTRGWNGFDAFLEQVKRTLAVGNKPRSGD